MRSLSIWLQSNLGFLQGQIQFESRVLIVPGLAASRRSVKRSILACIFAKLLEVLFVKGLGSYLVGNASISIENDCCHWSLDRFVI